MTLFSRRIASSGTRKWFLVLSISILLLAGFETLAELIGLYQVGVFLSVAWWLYVYLIVEISFVFDLRLKSVGSYARARTYYEHRKELLPRIARTLGRALKLRFHYLADWVHWKHFQNYLILFSISYWSIVSLIFLNPFSAYKKQIIAIAGGLMLAVVVWYLKTVFVSYKAAHAAAHETMFTVMALAAFFCFAALLGIHWYFGLTGTHFVISVAALGFLLMYQSLFREQRTSLYDFFLAVLGALMLGAVARIIVQVWTVNYYTGGLLLAGVLYLFWGFVLDGLRKQLNRRRTIEHLVVFILVLLFVITTTNFGARIG